MSATNRAALFGKIHKVLKKHYEPVIPPTDRSVLEHLLYSCVLENAKHEHVDEVFARLQKNYFDWNEVRVTSVPELAEVMAAIPDAAEAAKRMKRALQSVFEKYYQFDLESLRKAGLGKAVEALEKFNGVTPFVIDYMTQNALGGHAIPVNTSGLALLVALDGVNESDAAKNRVPGLERAIPKNKGAEFASLLHQLAIDFTLSPQGTKVKGIVGEIEPAAKDRLPKKAPTPPPAPVPVKRAVLPGTQPMGPTGGAKPPLGDKGSAKGPPATIPFERPEKGAEKGGEKGAEKSAEKSASERTSGEKGFIKEKDRVERERLAKEKLAKDKAKLDKEKHNKEKHDRESRESGAKASGGGAKPDAKKSGKPGPGKSEGKSEGAKSETKSKASAGGITRKKPK